MSEGAKIVTNNWKPEVFHGIYNDGFHTIDVENLRLHYNRTRLCWKKNFEDHMAEVTKVDSILAI